MHAGARIIRTDAEVVGLPRQEPIQQQPLLIAQLRSGAGGRAADRDETRIAHRRLQGSDGKREILTRGEFDLLAALAGHPGVVLSRERLMQTVSHRSWDPNDRTIDVLISRLRDKLEDDPKHPEIITTVRGEGYVLIAGDGGR